MMIRSLKRVRMRFRNQQRQMVMHPLERVCEQFGNNSETAGSRDSDDGATVMMV